MAQTYIDDDTQKRFAKFFEAGAEDELTEKMEEFKASVEEHATLEHEVKGESLEDVRSQLRKKFKDQFSEPS